MAPAAYVSRAPFSVAVNSQCYQNARMRLTLRNLCFLVIATSGSMFCCLPANAQPVDALQVLIINSYDENTAPYFHPRNVFMMELQERYTSHIAFRQFDLGQRSVIESRHEELKTQLLQHDYASTPPDLVVALGPPAVAFWLIPTRPMI